MRVPYDLTIVALTEEFNAWAHADAVRAMTWADLDDVAASLTTATMTGAQLPRSLALRPAPPRRLPA